MRTLQIWILPLAALIFVLFIYHLALEHNPPPVKNTSPIRISELLVIDTPYASNPPNVFSARNWPHSGSDTAINSSSQSPANIQFLQEDTFSAISLRMYNQQPFSKEQHTFLPSDRMYLVMEFENLREGKHRLSASWIDPEGKTVNKAEHTINLDAPAAQHRSFFWLELMKNGGFTELITGREYKGNIYGSWHVDLFLNGSFVARRHFIVRDT